MAPTKPAVSAQVRIVETRRLAKTLARRELVQKAEKYYK